VSSYSTAKLEEALVKKGFKENRNHHKMYRLYIDGKKTIIQTKTSHSEKDYDDNMLKQRRLQIGLPTKQQFLDFVECPLSEEQYLEILIETNRIRL